MNTIDLPPADLDEITRHAMQFWLYPKGGDDAAFRTVAHAEADQSDEWKGFRNLVIQVIAGVTMAGYTLNAPESTRP